MKIHTLFIFLQFSPNLLSVSRIPIFWGSSGLQAFHRLPLVLITLMALGSTGHILCSVPLSWDWSDVFFMIRLGLCAFGKKTIRGGHSYHVRSRTHMLTWLDSSEVDPNHLGETVFVRFLQDNVRLLSFWSYWTLPKEVTLHNPHLRNAGLYSISLGLRIYMKFLEF